MAAMLHYESSSSAWSLDSAALPITPSLSVTSKDETLESTSRAPTLHEIPRSFSAAPFLNATTISLSKSETNIFNLAKPFGAISPTIRPSPSLSTLQQKSERAEHKEPTSFGPHGRRRSNSLSEQTSPGIDKANSTLAPLSERRRSETSRYLGTDDFKSAFATNLLKLKQREKVDGEPASQASDLTSKTVEMGGTLPPAVNSQMKAMPCELPLVRAVQSDLVDVHTSMVQVRETHGAPTRKAHNAGQISSTVGQLMTLPAEDLEAQLEKHFNRLKSDRMEDELEARNEVISILAHQMSNQLEVNDKLLHELAALRAAYASLQSSCTDYVDELEFLRMKLRAIEAENEVDRSRRESEDKLRGLGQMVHESKKAFCRLQAEVLHQDKRRSLQNYHLEPRRNSSFTLAAEAAEVLSSPRRNSSYVLGSQTAGVLNTSSILLLSSENPQKMHGGPLTAPGLTNLTFPFKSAEPKTFSINSMGRNLSAPASKPTNKPARPPKSAARSNPASPAANKIPRGQSAKSVAAPSRANFGTQTSELRETEELEKLRKMCARLELELNESEDSRMASQDALCALRNYISSQPQAGLSAIKLPPLPTDLQVEDGHEEALSNRWNISNFVSRSNPLKSSGAGSASPYLKSPSVQGSPAFGNAFSGFNIWGRSPVLG
ncbi:hypothetical protein PTTG_04642 [Puccinia triticina 1-1 BBBD Race 1]|uniref:Uncharacterized protein n=2 Tax=Puccinia triticina TaxID=208348 RepID=A0A0C4EV10_PUCT1|nr:uncharacterized protein PtA15_6A878 [Puccinia triticina]OAV90262.1 hypothetical protein PTTG_04642 [Puccinia triticina 1-1 BBBD Race 1]WAQ86246.1 hypothetical protein PtA15_6A878 [Puccinia triticina]WAR56133.1 hypothetical protein PtB15_6B878 [Puccinia triticina]